MRITLIINDPDDHVAAQIRAEVERLRAEGHEVHPNLTFERGDARRLARSAALWGSDLVIAAGGDGTLNEVVNGLHDRLRERAEQSGGENGPEQPPRLGILPIGTANDFAHTLRIPEDPRAALETALRGGVMEVDVGRVGERAFLNVSTGGLGAEATEEAPSEAKRALGPLAYLITGVKKFVGLESSRARFQTDAELVFEGDFLIFAVGNAERTGGGNRITPRANPADGLLDLCIVRNISRVELLTLLPDLRAGRHIGHPAVVYRQLPRIRVESDHRLSVNVDGEPISGAEFDYSVSPWRIRVMVP